MKRAQNRYSDRQLRGLGEAIADVIDSKCRVCGERHGDEAALPPRCLDDAGARVATRAKQLGFRLAENAA